MKIGIFFAGFVFCQGADEKVVAITVDGVETDDDFWQSDMLAFC